MKRKIGARIRALHRAGKYRRSTRRTTSRRARRAAPVSVVRSYRSSRRSSRRSVARRSYSGGGSIGVKSVLHKDNLVMVGGALGATFLTNYGASLILPRLGGMGTNPFVRAAVKLGIAGLTAKLASRYSRPLAQGILLGGMLVVANDLIRQYGLPGASAAGTAAYLGGRRRNGGGNRVAAYLGGRNNPGLAPVSPTNPTFSRNGMGGVYQGGSAFKSDAWAR